MKIEEYIKKFFEYKNGEIIRYDRKNSLGSYDKDGYRILKIKGKQYKYHRVVWLLINGMFPTEELDHINRDRKDNTIENLRLANRKIQANNTRKIINPDTGVVGIYYDKNTKGLLAKYTFHKGKKSYRFRTLEEAIKMRKKLWKN